MHSNFWFDKDYFENNYSPGDKIRVRNLPYLPQEIVGDVGWLTGNWVWMENPLTFFAVMSMRSDGLLWQMPLHHFEKV